MAAGLSLLDLNQDLLEVINLSTRDKTLNCGYVDTPTTVDSKVPTSPTIPKLKETVKAIASSCKGGSKVILKKM